MFIYCTTIIFLVSQVCNFRICKFSHSSNISTMIPSSPAAFPLFIPLIAYFTSSSSICSPSRCLGFSSSSSPYCLSSSKSSLMYSSHLTLVASDYMSTSPSLSLLLFHLNLFFFVDSLTLSYIFLLSLFSRSSISLRYSSSHFSFISIHFLLIRLFSSL